MKRLLRGVVGDAGTRNLDTREEWLRRTLAAIPAGQTILDAGAGERQYEPLCAHLAYTSQDFAEYDGRGDEAGLQMGTWDAKRVDIVSDITAIPVPDASFDNVLCVEVLEHVPRPLDALRELARVLRPGGTLVLTAPVASITHFAPYYFSTGFSRYFYETLLPDLGLDVVEVDANGDFFQHVAQEVRRTDEVARRYADASVGLAARVAQAVLVRRLGRLSARGAASAELICHGIHVRAVKRP
jgi:ubiquinone/menaquinone biosynthesis C-methylase UbiE